MVKRTTARGCAPPENFWNLEALRLLLRPFLHEPIYAAWKPDNRVHMWQYLPFLPIASYNISFGFPIVHYSCKPHPSQMRLVRLFTANFNMSPLCLRALHGCPRVMGQIHDANQATSEGKSGLVETRLTRPAAMTLH